MLHVWPSYFWSGFASNGGNNIKTNVAYTKTVLAQLHPTPRQMLVKLRAFSRLPLTWCNWKATCFNQTSFLFIKPCRPHHPLVYLWMSRAVLSKLALLSSHSTYSTYNLQHGSIKCCNATCNMVLAPTPPAPSQCTGLLSDVASTVLFSLRTTAVLDCHIHRRQNNSQNVWNVATSPAWVAWLEGLATSNLLLAVWRAGEEPPHPFNHCRGREAPPQTAHHLDLITGLRKLQSENEEYLFSCNKVPRSQPFLNNMGL